MDRAGPRQLNAEEAKERLRTLSRRRPVAADAATVALDEARRHPWRTVGIALAVGVAVGASRTARRAALRIVRKALRPGF